jgi:hypothetical protein
VLVAPAAPVVTLVVPVIPVVVLDAVDAPPDPELVVAPPPVVAGRPDAVSSLEQAKTMVPTAREISLVRFMSPAV